MLIQKFNLYKSEWLELVFEKRNKNYGAYELRSTYAQTMARAITVTIFSFVAGAIILSILTRQHAAPVTTADHVTKVDFTRVLPPPPKDKPAAKVQPRHAATLKTQPATVVIPTQVTTKETPVEPPTITEISKAAVGTEPVKGVGAASSIPVEPAGGGDGAAAPAAGTDANTVLLYADVAPEPNGGMAGWAKFLQRSLRYPDTESQGRVIVSFVVERDGSLSDIKILKSVSAELDQEAMRVIKIAPKWKPGLQGGRAVRVQYSIPINFQLQ